MTMQLTPQLAADLMTTALEGGSNYWIGTICPQYDSYKDYSELDAYGPNMITRVFTPNDETLTWPGLNAALAAMETDYPSHYADIITDNMDADTADVFLQLALYGDVIYG